MKPDELKRLLAKPKEKDLHKAFVRYIKFKHPDIIFNTDMAGVYLPNSKHGYEAKELRSSNSFPDITIYKPMNGYFGLFIELKASGIVLKNRDGSWREKIKPQAEFMEQLEELGYCAHFAAGIDEAILMLETYLEPQ